MKITKSQLRKLVKETVLQERAGDGVELEDAISQIKGDPNLQYILRFLVQKALS